MNFSLPHGCILSVQFCGLYFVICLALLCFGQSRIENVDVFVYYKIPFMNVFPLLSVHYILKAWTAIFVLCSSDEMWAGYCSRYNGWLQAGRSEDPGGGEIFRICPDWPGAHPASCTMGTGSLPG